MNHGLKSVNEVSNIPPISQCIVSLLMHRGKYMQTLSQAVTTHAGRPMGEADVLMTQVMPHEQHE